MDDEEESYCVFGNWKRPSGYASWDTANHAGRAAADLICHPLDIGGAKSLPWIGGDRPSGADWRGVDPNYNLGQLVVDTLALLTPDTPVLVRMETMRRATVYAVWAMRDRKVGYSVKDDAVARQLLSELTARTRSAQAKGNQDAAAWFDAGYLAASYQQTGLKTGLNGYEMVAKALKLGAHDPAMEFAASVITEAGPPKVHRDHLQKALAGAKDGSLLARNLVLNYAATGRTISELRADSMLSSK